MEHIQYFFMAPIVCVVSLRRSRGKTRLIEYLVKEFRRDGMKVATIKHTSEAFDTKGKDTWRHAEAGALEVACVTPGELITIRRGNFSLEDGVQALHVEPDIILAEGFKRSDRPKILCAESVEEVEEALRSISNIVAVSGSVTEKADQVKILKNKFPQVKFMRREEIVKFLRDFVVKEWLKKLPRLDCGHCKYGSCAEMAVDDRLIPLSKWPQIMLREIILGFIRSLKLRDIRLEEASKVTIEIDLKG
ncbi:MAG: molybdopterin-guanine dinucleotide biosynthesis protein B [Candidatus Wolframiiraptor sp. EX4484-121]|nr:MAG: molybdopterin-guanine dinucleotide biosynthesis protein B [Candidatus Wolframiiraptor sp. EX4484-121]